GTKVAVIVDITSQGHISGGIPPIGLEVSQLYTIIVPSKFQENAKKAYNESIQESCISELKMNLSSRNPFTCITNSE
ncbi:unnamed protein product, partial [Larinioides sclopetarius]